MSKKLMALLLAAVLLLAAGCGCAVVYTKRKKNS